MGWPYEFVTLSNEEKGLRREALGHYAQLAHYSAFVPALLFLLFRGARVLYGHARRLRGQQYQEVPGSPAAKARRASTLTDAATRWRKFSWWMGDDVYFLKQHWGQRDEWILGIAWAFWLLVLCVLGTGKDYLHLTKRFGIIAVSQLPIQYLLALKSLNIFSWIFASSHEQVNRYHRVLGRIIYSLLVLHLVFYNVFFVRSGIWLKRFFDPVVFAGVVAFIAIHSLNTTATRAIRKWSYRVFFVTHLIAAFSVPVLIFFHANHVRFYLIEALVIFVVDLAVRKIITVTAPSNLEKIPGTNIIKIEANVPAGKISSFRARPGSHIYLNIPPSSRPSQKLLSPACFLYDFLYNPFSVASFNEETNSIKLITRIQAGPMTSRLSSLANASQSSSESEPKILLNIEGPYGAVGKVAESLLASGIDRILLFAGGVGATFALPIYRSLIGENDDDSNSSTPLPRYPPVKLIWAIRSASDATWAASSTGKSVLEDDNVDLYLTGDMGVGSSSAAAVGDDGSVEMTQLANQNQKRPDIKKIVNDTFRKSNEESVAVLVCGPAAMARDVRGAVRPWVMRGRRVWWHSETFGW